LSVVEQVAAESFLAVLAVAVVQAVSSQVRE
jgi:hypothetical protein